MGIQKYLNNQNWNIGFIQITPEKLIRNKKISRVKWMKHPYNDRFFADPFIFASDKDFIFVLAEELTFGEKGILVWLKVRRSDYKLVDRKVLLKLNTHLSYPHIIRTGGNVYILPENSESGKLTAYRFDEKNITLKSVGVISNEPLTDATLLFSNDDVFMMATQLPNSQEDAFLYKYCPIEKNFFKIDSYPVVKDSSIARMGGAFFNVNGNVYRPAQDCKGGYGKALTICQVKSIAPTYSEQPIFRIEPKSWRYNLGLHTLNFDVSSGIAVIDSYGYMYPIAGRILLSLYRLKTKIYGRKSR